MSRKRKMAKMFLAFMCAFLFLGFGSGICANAESNLEFAYSSSDFGFAVKKAKDGDRIIIVGEIKVSGSFGSADKTVKVERFNEDSRLIARYGTEFQNIVFDGKDYISAYPMVTAQGDFLADACTFQNCKGEKESVIGGAVQLETEDATFTGCSFYDNTSVSGGHIAVKGGCTANITNCTFKDGYAKNNGGAISVFNGASCYIDSCVITENEAVNYGGGIGNRSYIQMKNTKIWNNQTQYGGADIGNGIGATADLQDSIEQLVELFKEDNITPKGWICDYDFEENLYIPDIEPTQENALLKLDYEIIEPEPEIPPAMTDPEQSETPDDPKDPTETDPSEDVEPDELPKQDEAESPKEQQTPGNSEESEAPPKSGPDESKDNTPDGSDIESPATGSADTPTATPSNSDKKAGSSSSEGNLTETNATTDNSRRTTTNDSNNTSTVNNYYGEQAKSESSQQPDVQTIVIPVDSTADGKSTEQTIKIESAPEGSVSGNTEGATLNINVNIGSETEGQQAAATTQAGVSWYQAVVIALLFGIFVCLLRRRQ